MSKHYDPVGQPSLDIMYCAYCKKETEQHRYLVKGWRCIYCNQ